MASTSAVSSSNDGLGIFMVILSEVLLASVNTIVKSVHNWPAQRMMIIRNPVDFCLCITMSAYFGYKVPGPKVASLLVLRGVVYISFLSLFWVSIRSCLPLGDVIVTVVTFSPVFLVLLSRLALGEKIPKRWPLQFGLCVLGALLINKPLAPNPTCPTSSALWPLAAAFMGGMMNFCSRNVKDVPPPVVCMFNDIVAVIFATVTSAFGILGAGDGGAFSVLPAAMDHNVALLVLAGVIGWAGLIANVKGYQSVSVAAIASIAGYVAVPLGYAIQVVIFNEPIDALSAVGAALIVFTNITAILQKHLEQRQVEEKHEGYKPFLDTDGLSEQAQNSEIKKSSETSCWDAWMPLP